MTSSATNLLLAGILLLCSVLLAAWQPVTAVIEPPTIGSTIPPIEEPPTPFPTQPPIVVQHNLYFPVAGNCYTPTGEYVCQSD